MKTAFIALLFSIVLGVAFLSGWRYIEVLRDKQKVEDEISRTKQQLVAAGEQLKQEIELRGILFKEKEKLQVILQDTEDQVESLNLTLAQERQEAAEQISSLTREAEALRQASSVTQVEKTELERKLSLLEDRNNQLETKFQSIPELKNAIRDLKRLKNKANIKYLVIPKVFKKPPQAAPPKQNSDSNFGFVVKDGITTYRHKVKIEVNPAQ